MNRIIFKLTCFTLVFFGCGGQQKKAAPQEETATAVSQISGDELVAALEDADVFLLDVRNPEELEELGTVEGYVNIPLGELADRLDELPRDKPILTA